MAAPLLSFWERAPPYGALAVSGLAGVPIEAKADPKATKDTSTKLTLPSG